MKFDVRNQTITLAGNGTAEGEDGAQVQTVTSDNATVTYDTTIRYSLNPDMLEGRASVPRPGVVHRPCRVARCLRGHPRRADHVHRGDRAAVRGPLSQRVKEGLETRLAAVGVTVEQVDPQRITLDGGVQANYDKVQSSLANAEAAKADLQTASPTPRSPRPTRRRSPTPTRSSAAARSRRPSTRSSTASRSAGRRSRRSRTDSVRTASTSRC